jgi:carbamoyltransferase
VTKEMAPFFYDLIKRFGDLTGVYCLLNTSFNRHGIATISSPLQAIEHLLYGVVDVLVLNNYVINLSENRIQMKEDNSEVAQISEYDKLNELNTVFQKIFYED